MFLQYVQGSPVEAQRSLDLMMQVSLSLTKNCLFILKSRESVVLAYSVPDLASEF